MYNLKDKVAIVTGAGGQHGFGSAIALRLAKEGVDIAAVDKVSKPSRPEDAEQEWRGIESVAELAQKAGRRAMAVICDVTDSKDVDRMVQDVVAKFGHVDILVNNAGVKINQPILEITDEIWNLHLAVNLTGSLYCARAAAREMVKQGKGGHIINIGSMWAKVGSSNKDAAYCVSKFGVVGLTQCLALELAQHNILVNCVCPALTDTGFNRALFKAQAAKEGISPEEVRARMNAKVASGFPLGRLGTAEDIANMVAFLLSDEASFITGQSINVNGGAFTAH